MGRMRISLDASRWGSTLALAVILSLVACSAGSIAPTQPSPTANASLAPSATASPSGLVTTTEPADVAPPGATKVTLTSFKFEPTSLAASAGTAVFFLTNPDAGGTLGAGINHNMVIGSELGQPIASSSYVPGGESAVFTVEGLAAGTYVIWCTVPHHAENGMVGTLTVTP
jgi:uncharacterized cupredoxin-like copper-binding protein